VRRPSASRGETPGTYPELCSRWTAIAGHTAPCRARPTARCRRPPGSGPSSRRSRPGRSTPTSISASWPDGGGRSATPGPASHDPNFGDIRIGAQAMSPDALSISVPTTRRSEHLTGDVLDQQQRRLRRRQSRPLPRHAPRGRPRPRLRRRHRPLVGDVCPVHPNGVLHRRRPGGAPVALRSAPARRQLTRRPATIRSAAPPSSSCPAAATPVRPPGRLRRHHDEPRRGLLRLRPMSAIRARSRSGSSRRGSAS